jgi:hypothetical protein
MAVTCLSHCLLLSQSIRLVQRISAYPYAVKMTTHVRILTGDGIRDGHLAWISMAKIRQFGVFVLVFGVLFAVRYALAWFAYLHREAFLVAFVVAVAGITVTVRLDRRRRHRRMLRQAAEAGWTPIELDGRGWPWDGQLPPQGKARVEGAWTRVVDGYPVTVGRIRWSGNAFIGLVRELESHGIVTVVKLPQSQPPMALRAFYRFVGDSPKLDRPELRWAALRNEIPTWTVVGDELFIVEAHPELITPEVTDRAVRQALHVVGLLEIGPASDYPPAPAPDDDGGAAAAVPGAAASGLDVPGPHVPGLDVPDLDVRAGGVAAAVPGAAAAGLDVPGSAVRDTAVPGSGKLAVEPKA